MKERIRMIMEAELLTPSAFADMLEIGRAVMSHILNGRNNPSLDVVTRILTKLPYINPDWLLTGSGNMYKVETGKEDKDESQNSNYSSYNQTDLFSQPSINTSPSTVETKNEKEIIVETSENDMQIAEKQEFIYKKISNKKIIKIIIYYSDNTFETFNADNKLL